MTIPKYARNAKIRRLSKEGMSHTEIAAQYGLSLARVSQIVHRVRKNKKLVEGQ